MKMFKQLLTGAIAAACVLGMAMSVAAENVPSVIYDNNAVTKVTADNGKAFVWVDLEQDELSRLPEKVVKAIEAANSAETPIVNSVEAFVKAADDPVITDAFGDGKGWVWRSTFGDLQPVAGGKDTTTEGTFNMTFTVPGISSYADWKFVHYDEKLGWQILKVVAVNGDNITVEFQNTSPAAIAVVLKTQPTPTPTVTPTPTPTGTPTPTPSKPASSDTSPKTGVNTGWMGFAAAAAILAVCGAVVSRKKRA